MILWGASPVLLAISCRVRAVVSFCNRSIDFFVYFVEYFLPFLFRFWHISHAQKSITML
jgi:hypothetical protein